MFARNDCDSCTVDLSVSNFTIEPFYNDSSFINDVGRDDDIDSGIANLNGAVCCYGSEVAVMDGVL
jgi:hypothetical protein